MPLSSSDALIRDLSELIDRGVPEPESRERIQAKLLELQRGTATLPLETNFTSALADSQSTDRWTSRARPTFLYVVYAMILWALPMGLVAAFSPRVAHAIAAAMTGYLGALPEPLYTLFGTGYLGYATLRQWGKVKGTDR